MERELAAYCSGELDPAARDRVRLHLEVCAGCRAELAREREIREVLGSLPRGSFPPELAHRIEAATWGPAPAAPAAGRRTRLTAALILAAAGLAAALLLPGPRTAFGPKQVWTKEEIAEGRREVMFTLALTSQVIDRTRRDAVVEVFADKLPHAIDESFKMVKPTISGGKE
jgi:anti-sigma factor RsiW